MRLNDIIYYNYNDIKEKKSLAQSLKKKKIDSNNWRIGEIKCVIVAIKNKSKKDLSLLAS
jgi:hypothetical protein